MTKVLWMMPSAELGEDNGGVEQSLGNHIGLLEFSNTVQEMVEVFAEQANTPIGNVCSLSLIAKSTGLALSTV
ncbi:hypothetical protein PtB15_2B663 [Puccinia triticina]|nr:hypothetical protein PtB15_2B663 [Puccinia triticina]